MTSTAGRILGNYQLGEPIGRGGASEVFAGVHRFLGHEVAVKLLRADLPGGASSSSVDAFLGEAARARAVRHPNLVSVLDFGRDDATGRCYLVMERIPGESLAERLRRVGRLAESELRALGAALADAMQAAHDGGIVHRDLKPANVMLRGDQPTVVDFGLARDLGGQSALETDRRAGTPAYMAPEQLTGGLIAPCVDVWSLGVILFEAATGKLPFEGFADGRCPQLFETAPRVASLVQVTPDLDALIATCLERSPGRRPSTMAVIARALRGEGEERVTQDVAEPSMSQPAPGANGSLGSDGAAGLSAARAGQSAARAGHSAARARDTAAAVGDPAAGVGDRVATSPRARLAPDARATRSGLFALRPRHWLLVALAAVAASLAAIVTVRATGARPSGGPALSIGAPEDAPPAVETAARPSRRGPGAPSPTGVMEEAIAKSRVSGARSDAPEETSGAGVPGAATSSSAAASSNPAATSSSPVGGLPSAAATSPSASATSPGPTATSGEPAGPLAIDIRSTPSGADVLIAGKRRGRTPIHLELPGPGRVLLRKRGYRPAAVRVERAGLLDVHLTRRGRARPSAERPARKQPDRPRGEGLD